MSGQHGEEILRAKDLTGFLPVDMMAAPQGVISPLRASCWSSNTTRFPWVKILSSFWTSDGGAISVVPFLEASSLETYLSSWHFWFIRHGRL